MGPIRDFAPTSIVMQCSVVLYHTYSKRKGRTYSKRSPGPGAGDSDPSMMTDDWRRNAAVNDCSDARRGACRVGTWLCDSIQH